MTKIVGLQDIKSGGQLQQEIQQGGKDGTREVVASMVSASQQPG